MNDKVALITGASRGVGLATARALVARGAKVAIAARGEGRLRRAEAELRALGGDVLAVAGDVGDPTAAAQMVAATLARFGRLDMLINNAGVSMRGRFDELSPAVCEQVIRTNLMGSVLITRAAIEAITAARGHVVFISSIAGLFGLPGASAYCASKAALSALCESLRLELGPRGVHVGVVHLGFTEHDPEKRILAADGTPVPPDRPAHHTQAQAAALIVRMIERRKRRLIMTPAGVAGWLAYRLSPGLVERAILMAQAGNWGVYRRFA